MPIPTFTILTVITAAIPVIGAGVSMILTISFYHLKKIRWKFSTLNIIRKYFNLTHSCLESHYCYIDHRHSFDYSNASPRCKSIHGLDIVLLENLNENNCYLRHQICSWNFSLKSWFSDSVDAHTQIFSIHYPFWVFCFESQSWLLPFSLNSGVQIAFLSFLISCSSFRLFFKFVIFCTTCLLMQVRPGAHCPWPSPQCSPSLFPDLQIPGSTFLSYCFTTFLVLTMENCSTRTLVMQVRLEAHSPCPCPQYSPSPWPAKY